LRDKDDEVYLGDLAGAPLYAPRRRFRRLVAIVIGVSLVVFIVALLRSSVKAERSSGESGEYLITKQCQEAGGIELVTSQGRYCMKKELFVDPDRLSK
jgi:hypothetical protein